MSSLSAEVDAALNSLDPTTALKFERLIRDAIALVCPSKNDANSAALDASYFDSVIGAFSNIDFERPTQRELPETKWSGE